jgi:hypothetical protein
MRRVNKAAIPIPDRLTSADCMADLNLLIADPENCTGNRDFYRGKVEMPNGKKVSTVAIALKDLYNNKCAYCEKLCYHPEVEHFRPKGRVIGPNPNPYGYYWLCYEWTNLVPSCHDCNSVEAKGDKFPITGVRCLTHPVNGLPPAFDLAQTIYTTGSLLAEAPLFIHPEYCIDFSVHFNFLGDGRMVGISPEGIATVTEMKLDNETLSGLRREIYKKHYNSLRRALLKYKRPVNGKSEEWFTEEIDELVSLLVHESLDHEEQFTFFRKFLVTKIDYFFVTPLEDVFQNEVRQKISEALLKV